MVKACIRFLLVVVVVVVVVCGRGEASQAANDVIRDAVNKGLGGGYIPQGADFNVKDWKGVSASHSFPGGSVSGSSYTGKLGNGSQNLKCEAFFILLTSLVTFFVAKL